MDENLYLDLNQYVLIIVFITVIFAIFINFFVFVSNLTINISNWIGYVGALAAFLISSTAFMFFGGNLNEFLQFAIFFVFLSLFLIIFAWRIDPNILIKRVIGSTFFFGLLLIFGFAYDIIY